MLLIFTYLRDTLISVEVISVKEYQNITLSLPKDLLIKVKHLAIDKNTSVSGLLYKTLEELVNKQYAYEKAKNHHLSILGKTDLNTKGSITWKREDLYDR